MCPGQPRYSITPCEVHISNKNKQPMNELLLSLSQNTDRTSGNSQFMEKQTPPIHKPTRKYKHINTPVTTETTGNVYITIIKFTS